MHDALTEPVRVDPDGEGPDEHAGHVEGVVEGLEVEVAAGPSIMFDQGRPNDTPVENEVLVAACYLFRCCCCGCCGVGGTTVVVVVEYDVTT